MYRCQQFFGLVQFVKGFRPNGKTIIDIQQSIQKPRMRTPAALKQKLAEHGKGTSRSILHGGSGVPRQSEVSRATVISK
jgi:hypothetical protein